MLTISEMVAYSYSPVTVPAKMEDSYVNTVIALARHVDSLGSLSNTHISRTSVLARSLGKKLGVGAAELETLSMAGLLHDVGKAFIPELILTKPTSLTEAEWEIMRQHPSLGVKILRPVNKFQPVLPIVLAHHERYDGKGYPNKLSGEDIPFGARLLTIVDAFTAMTAGRVYQQQMTQEEATAELYRCRGTHFDARAVEAFLEVLKESIIPA